MLSIKNIRKIDSGSPEEYYQVMENLDEYTKSILKHYKIKAISLKRLGGLACGNIEIVRSDFNLVLKISPYDGILQVAKFFYEKTITLKIPVPKVYYIDKTKSLIPFQFMIMEFLEGTNIQKLSSNFYEEAGIQLGKKLNKIHSIKIVNFNEEIANYTKWSHDKWVERLSYYINSFPNTVKQKIFTIDQINKVENIVNNTILKIKFPSLLHGDIHEDNLLYRLSDGKIKLTGVIDLNTTFGDPMLDLAIIKVHEIDKRKLNDFYKDIFKGYGILTMEETIKMNYLKLLYLYWYIGNRFMNDKPFRSHLNYFNRELNYSYL